MELLGITLSVPVAFFISMLYCFLLAKFVSKLVRFSQWLRMASYVFLSLFAVEVLLLITVGAVRSRGIIGPGFYVAHVVFVFLCPPALANILVLRKQPETSNRWRVGVVLSTIFAFFLVLLQYSVSESLYGIDGENGPYSENPSR